MVTYKGSHGTTKVRAKKVAADGFPISGGRFVTGAYFWLESYLSFDLAIGWYRYRIPRYIAEGETKPECAVIIAQLSCNDNEFIDLDGHPFKDRLFRLAEIRHTNPNDDREIYALYAYAIDELERVGRITFKVVLLKARPPAEQYCPRYKLMIYGYPTCLIARSKDCIEIISINYPKVV